MQTGQSSHFFCNKWLAVDKDDGNIERVLPVASEDETLDFKNRVGFRRQEGLTDTHLWFSVFLRPTTSIFTRVERLSCCLCLLLAYLISNAMFYKTDSEAKKMTFTWVRFGPIQFSLQQIYIGTISTLVVFPVNAIIVTIFRKTKRSGGRVPVIFRRCCKRCTACQSEWQLPMESDECTLPYWCLYIGWIGVFLVTLTSAFFVIMYSMQWGAGKSADWLSSCITSFCESVLLIEPMQGLVFAYLLSLVIRKPVLTKPPDNSFNMLNNHDKDSTSPEHVQIEMGEEDSVNPLRSDEIEIVKQRRTREKKLISVFYGILAYMALVAVSVTLCQYVRTPMTFQFNSQLKNTLVYAKPQFNKIRTHADFWTWIDKVFLPNMYKASEDPAALMADGRTFHVGVPRLRQQRHKKGTCDGNVYSVDADFECEVRGQMETSDFDVGWRSHPPDSNKTSTENPWKSSSVNGMSYWGRHGNYDATGYIATFPNKTSELLELMRFLAAESWIDGFTSVVLVEFDLYSPDSNLFSSVVYMVEFLDIGSSECRVEQNTFRLLHKVFGFNTSYAGNVIVVFICWLLFAVLAIVVLVSITKRLVRQRLVFFKLPWNIFDLALTVTSFASLIAMAICEVTAKVVISDIKENASGNLQRVAALSNTLTYILAVDMFLVILRFLKLMRFNRRMMLLSMTLREAKNGLISFSIFYVIILLMFTHSGYLTFGTYLPVFKSFFDITSLLFSVSVGKFPTNESLDTTGGQLSTFVLLLFALFNVMITMNIFIAVITDAFSIAKAENDKSKNHFEMLNYLWTRLKDMVNGIGLWNIEKEDDWKENNVEKDFVKIERRLNKIAELLDKSV
ncbi:polycystin-1-like protein 2 [Glandiceps talaboti]